MAKIERSINEDFAQLLSNIENGILNSSISATLVNCIGVVYTTGDLIQISDQTENGQHVAGRILF